MAKAPLILGLVAGILGLLMTAILFFAALLALAFGAGFLMVIVLAQGLGAILGIAGGIVSLFRERVGGAVLLSGFAIAILGWLFGLSNAAGQGLNVGGFLTVMSFVFLWWGALILVGGLLAIRKRPLSPLTPTPLS